MEFYADFNQGLCLRCHNSCVNCKGGFSWDCISCDADNGLSLKNGSCLKEGCPNGSVVLENRSCLNLAQCIEAESLFMPRIFNMELDPLVVKISLKIKEVCLDYKKGFGLIWDPNSSLYDIALASADNNTLTIPRDGMKEGLVNLKLDIMYENRLTLTSFNQTTVLVLNKVIYFNKCFFQNYCTIF